MNNKLPKIGGIYNNWAIGDYEIIDIIGNKIKLKHNNGQKQFIHYKLLGFDNIKQLTLLRNITNK